MKARIFVKTLGLCVLAWSTIQFTSCSEHTPAPNQHSIDTIYSFFNADSLPFSEEFPPYDSVCGVMYASTYEDYDSNSPDAIDAYASFFPRRGVHGISVGQVTISSAILNPSILPLVGADGDYVEYRVNNLPQYIPSIQRPLFGQITRWKVPENSVGIISLDTMLYTLPPLYPSLQGLDSGSSNGISTTSSLTLTWNTASINHDSVQIVLDYDGFLPINQQGGRTPERKRLVAFVPDNGSCVIPSTVLQIIPPESLFRIEINRLLTYPIANNGKYIIIRSYNSAEKFLYLY